MAGAPSDPSFCQNEPLMIECEETMETVADFIFWGSKITEDGDCSHEIKEGCSLEDKL